MSWINNMQFGVILSLICFSNWGFSQTIEINDEGEKIVRFDDGSWRYYEPGDSVYVILNKNNNHKKEESNAMPDQKILPELELKIERSKNKIVELEKSLVDLADKREQLNTDILNSNDKEQTIEWNDQLQSVIKEEREQQQILSNLNEELAHLEEIKGLPVADQYRLLGIETPAKKKPEKNNNSQSPKNSPPVEVDKYVLQSAVSCKTEKNEDELNKILVTSTQEELLFTYTPEVMREYIKDKAFIESKISLIHKQGSYFLYLIVDIGSQKAKQNYGYIKSGSALNLQDINGEVYTLKSQNSAIGRITAQETTRYEVAYPIDARSIKTFQNLLLDKVRIVWSTGFEDYDIYDVQVLSRQIECLNKNI